MRKTKLWLITIAALLCSLAASAHDFEVGGVYYNITSSTDLTVAVTYRGDHPESYSDEYRGTVTIPESVTYRSNTYRVTLIEGGAFEACNSLTAINIPGNVQSIGGRAFLGCSNLTTINIPENSKLTSIASYAFYECSSLKSINIPESMANIGGAAFADCSSLIEINIPEGVKSIEYSTFDGCSSLGYISISENVKSIGDGAFRDCLSLTSITIPKNMTSIGNRAFYGCSNLGKVINYSKLSLYRGSSDYGFVTYYAKKVINGANLTSIGDFQFYTSNDVHYLTNYIGKSEGIVLPENYKGNSYEIDDYAFYGCCLYSVTIPNGVLSIGNNSFRTYPYTAPIKVIWQANTPPKGYKNIESGTNYVSNNQYTGLNNAIIYPNLSSMFEVNGVKYVPTDIKERTCHAIDCVYDTSATAINVSETVSFKGIEMKVTEIMPSTFRENKYIKEVSVSHLGNIGNYVFTGCNSIENIILSNQGDIAEEAFYNCKGIKNVEIANIGNIGERAFYDCTDIETIFVSNQGNIGDYAFWCCTALKTLILGDGIKALGDAVFCECSSLQEITIPHSVKSIGESCFRGCSSMKSAVIGDGITTISDETFAECPALTNIVLGRNLSTINSYAFQNCSSLTEIVIPQSTTTIGNYAFKGCTQLADVIIENRATALSLGSNGSSSLFADCALDSVYIGGKITYNTTSSKGYSPFYRNTSLRSVMISDQEEQIYDNEFYGCTNLQNATIGDGVKSIGDYAFYNCSSLKTIVLGDSIRTLGSYAFYQCKNLQAVAIPNFVATIGTNCFDGCSALNSITLGNSIATIQDYAFNNCSSLLGISIPQATTTIGNYVFSGCAQLTNVIIENRTTALNIGCNGSSSLFADCSLDSVYIGGEITYETLPFSNNTLLRSVVITGQKEQVNDSEFYGCTNLQNVTIGDKVKNIGDYAFYNCSSLQSIALSDSISTLDSYAFYNCKNLQDIVIPDLVVTIGSNCFDNCSALNSITIGNGVKTINSYAFNNCSALDEIVIPQSTTTIGNYVFKGCAQLADVIIDDRATALSLGSNGSSSLFADCALDSVYIGGKITYNTSSSYGYSPFYRNTSLRSVVISDEEEQIYNNEFYGCSKLQNVSVGDSVKSIGNYAFSGCSSLESFTFGSCMETIGAEAFSDCSSLTSITSYAAVPPTCGTQALDDIDVWGCTLTVPDGRTAAYREADQWCNFFFIEETTRKYTLTYMIDGEVYYSESLPHEAEIILPETPMKEGYTFNGWSEIPTTMPAEDLTINGTFTINTYTITYIVDGEEYEVVTVEYGSTITPLAEPTKEGYTFSGWSEIPATMPAEDLTISGTFVRNQKVYSLKVSAVGYATLYLDYAVEIPAGVEVYIAASVESNKMKMTKVTDVLPAYTGVIVKADAGTYDFVESSETPEEVESNMLIGTITNTYITAAPGYKYYILAQVDGVVAMYRAKLTNKQFLNNANKAYLPLYGRLEMNDDEVDTELEQLSNSVRFDFGGTTSIDELQSEQAETIIYDLNGRRVLNTDNLKGIYIVNGKKVVIK